MPLIINQQRVNDDTWLRVSEEQPLPSAGDRLVPWALWCEHKATLKAAEGRLGVLIEPDQELEALAPDLPDLALVAINFPSFADGRGFSLARLLREKYGFTGQVRAVGAVSWDRLRFMARCGFDALEVPEERYSDDMLQAFDEISVRYQGAADDPRPLFRR
ncbi:DUF934 domain-containing protein [Motiliproteus sp. SC1-56]|uniref:DUF934 domain-containing protein n=1 Tax=Motiliproteus sp. SC1-56 TaxID=2799565 RepID=UPI001A903DB2|nr:DUF934 domain-containing protein [Motiliproteus sp. SC1-56]